MKRISVVIGTRPEAIKMAPIILALKKERIALSVCKTGQHTDMVDSVLDIFDIVPDVNFSIMGSTDTLNDTTALLLQKYQMYFDEFKPDVVLIQGDTVSAVAAAVAAFNMHIDIAHIEAGLRTGDLTSPWPEEGFRSIISPITKYHFAPTDLSVTKLLLSGVRTENIFMTGNTVIDALHLAEDIIKKKNYELPIPEIITKLTNVRKILITGHRRENFGSGLNNLCGALAKLAHKYTDVDFIFPVHLNPIVQAQVNTFFQTKNLPNVYLIEPQPYLEFVWLMKQSYFIITDSGGIQEEAPGLGKPVLVTRDTTERPEGIEAGTVQLVGTSETSLFEAADCLLQDKEHYQKMAQAKNPYGDGTATEKILKVIL